MTSTRVIARLDIKAPNLVKGVHLEGLRIMGSPKEFAQKYYDQGADEILYQDIVASLYGRNNILDLVSETVSDIFIPMTVGGGIRSIDDVRGILRGGADKVVVNTAATKRPELISELANTFGAQCTVVAIEVIRQGPDRYGVFTDNGREPTKLDAIEWAKICCDMGAGEILVTSVDREGTGKGFDIELLQRIRDVVNIPIIAHGGAGKPEDAVAAIKEGGADAVAIARILHHGNFTIGDVKTAMAENGIEVRL